MPNLSVVTITRKMGKKKAVLEQLCGRLNILVQQSPIFVLRTLPFTSDNDESLSSGSAGRSRRKSGHGTILGARCLPQALKQNG
jgi:hypothetical protein